MEPQTPIAAQQQYSPSIILPAAFQANKRRATSPPLDSIPYEGAKRRPSEMSNDSAHMHFGMPAAALPPTAVYNTHPPSSPRAVSAAYALSTHTRLSDCSSSTRSSLSAHSTAPSSIHDYASRSSGSYSRSGRPMSTARLSATSSDLPMSGGYHPHDMEAVSLRHSASPPLSVASDASSLASPDLRFSGLGDMGPPARFSALLPGSPALYENYASSASYTPDSGRFPYTGTPVIPSQSSPTNQFVYDRHVRGSMPAEPQMVSTYHAGRVPLPSHLLPPRSNPLPPLDDESMPPPPVPSATSPVSSTASGSTTSRRRKPSKSSAQATQGREEGPSKARATEGSTKSATGRYACQLCTKKFSRPSSLKIHMYVY